MAFGHDTRILAALSAANEAILRTASENDLFHRVCDAIVAEGNLCAAALLADADSLLRVVAGSGNQIDRLRTLKLSVDPTCEYGRGLASTAFQTGLPAISNDYINDNRFLYFREEALQNGARSVAAIPIKKNGSSVGALLFYFDQPDVLDQEALRLLDRMAANVSFALDKFEQQKLRQQAEHARERLARMFAALSETNEAIMRAKTRNELCDLVCEAAVLGGMFKSSSISFVAPDRNSLKVTAAAGRISEGFKGTSIPIDTSLAEGRSLSEIALKTRKACVSNDYVNDPRLTFLRNLVKNNGAGSVAVFPLLANDDVIGMLGLQAIELGAFTPDLVDLLQRLADNLSFALANFDRADEKVRADERINYLATHDGLTGLPNRMMFNQLLNVSIETSRRYDRRFALLFIDLDRFKVINDTLGHAEGDRLLIEISERFRKNVRACDVVARLGGDEFVVLLQETADHQHVAEVARKLLSAAMQPVMLNGQDCRVTASIGVAAYPADGDDQQTLMKNADMAMYLAKAEGKNGVRFYGKSMTSHSTERLMMEANLRHAVARGELVVHYQPKRELASRQITGVEALLRWNHPDLGLLSPHQFIPLAEQTGLIVPIGRWVLKTVCNQNMAWQQRPPRHFDRGQPLATAIHARASVGRHR